MKSRYTAPALIGVLALGTSTAFALPLTLTGTYSISEQYNGSHGGPTVTNELSQPLSIHLTTGTETTPTNFFMLNPAGSCSGGGCNSATHTETDLLTIDFSNLDIAGIGGVSSASETGTFTAKYSGSELSCATGDGVSPSSGATDCFVWTGAANTYNGSTMLSESLGSGYDLDIFFYNKTDWTVTPQVGFELVHTSVPEPATLALFAVGLAALGLGRRKILG